MEISFECLCGNFILPEIYPLWIFYRKRSGSEVKDGTLDAKRPGSPWWSDTESPVLWNPRRGGGVRATPAWSLRCSTSLYNQLLKFKMEVRWSFVARMGLLQQYVVHKFTYFSGFSSKISMYFVHSQDRDYKDNISGNCNDNSEVTQPIRHHIVPQKYTDCLNQRHR